MSRMRTGLLIAAALLCTTPASGGLFEDVFQGLDLYSTPTGTSGGGRANGARFGRLRIVPNQFGQGHRLELDRTFGNDSFGRPELYDLGAFELQLSGATQATFGYTSNGFLIGNGDIRANNLSYTLRNKTGAQDVELRGSINADGQMEINQFGFYTLNLDVSNTGSLFDADGLAVDGDVDADWNIGPISIEGNIFFDATVAIMTSLGLDTSVFEGVFPGSPIDRINAMIVDRMGFDTQVAGEFLGVDTGGMTISEAAANEARDFVNDFALVAANPADFGPPPADGAVPEPASLTLLGMIALASLRRR